MAEWYKDWFDTKYYHILYKNRNYTEAENFIKHLVNYLKLEEGASILDMPCGIGRHAIHLNQLGYNVLGADLSACSIEKAGKQRNQGLEFVVHDMRKPLENRKFDLILNLFTSLGYFEDAEDDQKVINSFAESLNESGSVIIDFLNVSKTVSNLNKHEVVSVDGIEFRISKSIENGFILKRIEFEAEQAKHNYVEKVRMIRLDQFEEMLNRAGIRIENTFGDYNLSTFDPENSERLIIIGKRMY